MNEIWVSVIGYENCYEVSNIGRVKSVSRTVDNGSVKQRKIKEHILAQTDNGNGYVTVMLSKHGKTLRCSVHRLVARHFVENYSENLVVNHIDYNRKNNNVSNLEMVTQKQNIDHSKCNRLASVEIEVDILKKMYLYELKSVKNIAAHFKVSSYTIRKAIKENDMRITRTWLFVDENECAKLRCEGFTYKAISKLMGVSIQKIKNVLSGKQKPSDRIKSVG